jgi:hypothetical protein
LVTALSAIISQACGLITHNSSKADETAATAGTPGSGGGAGGGTSSGGATLSIGGRDILGTDESGGCDQGGNLLAEQAVTTVGPQRVLYSWTTDEQVEELRNGGELFSRSERPGMGRGLLFTDLAALAAADTTPAAQLAAKLEGEVFAKARFAWPNPWATLLGVPGESYGTQLLRIELKSEAWIALLNPQGLAVFDRDGQAVDLAQALANPSRIGAIYYQAAGDPNVTCEAGTFTRRALGFREFAVGNLAMVASWELATPQITERMRADIRELGALEKELACVSLGAESEWEHDAICQVGESFGGPSLANYNAALGMPSYLYFPNRENLEALIAALEASLPSGEPLSVTPGP